MSNLLHNSSRPSSPSSDRLPRSSTISVPAEGHLLKFPAPALSPHSKPFSLLALDTHRSYQLRHGKESDFHEGAVSPHLKRSIAETAIAQSDVFHDVDLSEAEVFRLFNISEISVVTDEERAAFPESGSVGDVLEQFTEEKIKPSTDQVVKHLASNDYFLYPLRLARSYRIIGYSAHEPQPLPSVRCENGTIPSKEAQHVGGTIMAQAVRQVARHISEHTQFDVYEAQAGEAADITILTTLCAKTAQSYSGRTSSFATRLRNHLTHPIFAKTSEEYEFSLAQVEEIADQFRQQYGAKSNIVFKVGSDFSSTSTAGTRAWFLAAHELGHALGLVDVTLEQRLAGLEAYYLVRSQAIVENTVMAYDTMPMIPPGYQQQSFPYPQSLMPYDYAALDWAADYIRRQVTHSAEGGEGRRMPNSLLHKSPHRGDTYYRVTADDALEIIDSRGATCPAYAYTIYPTKEGHMQWTLVDPDGYDTLDFRALPTRVHSGQKNTGVAVNLNPRGFVLYNHARLSFSTAVNEAGAQFNYYARANLYLPASNHSMYLIEAVFGSRGNDIVYGNQLDNSFVLGKGRDLVAGGPGCDSFAFARGDQRLTITDFDVRCDSLALHPNLNIRTYARLMAHTSKNSEGHLEIDLHRGDKIILQNLSNKHHLRRNNLMIYGYAQTSIKKD